MKLSAIGLQEKAQWEAAGYDLPKFDREAVTAATKENPFWIHFGAGNIFRAFPAHFYDTGIFQYLNVMRHCRAGKMCLLRDLSDTDTGTFFHPHHFEHKVLTVFIAKRL